MVMTLSCTSTNFPDVSLMTKSQLGEIEGFARGCSNLALMFGLLPAKQTAHSCNVRRGQSDFVRELGFTALSSAAEAAPRLSAVLRPRL